MNSIMWAFISSAALMGAAPEVEPGEEGHELNSLQDLRKSDEQGHCMTIYENEAGTLWDHVKWDKGEWVLLAGVAVASIPQAEGATGILLHSANGQTEFHKLDDPGLKLIADRIGAVVQLPRLVAIPLGREPKFPCESVDLSEDVISRLSR